MRITLALLGLLIGLFAQAQEQPVKQLDKKKKTYEVLASCGTCNFKMKAEGCPLAIKWNDKVYLVEGTSIDDHGDTHQSPRLWLGFPLADQMTLVCL